mmetsp:Transcript_24233/g.78162  ORF Transcript_24233/g.78162 Transcript_24233/m.78162 type:complete len:261 (-) Transcript_24233:188-970(-)
MHRLRQRHVLALSRERGWETSSPSDVHARAAAHQSKDARDPHRLARRGAPEVQAGSGDIVPHGERDRPLPEDHGRRTLELAARRRLRPAARVQVRGDLPAGAQGPRLHHRQGLHPGADFGHGGDDGQGPPVQHDRLVDPPLPHALPQGRPRRSSHGLARFLHLRAHAPGVRHAQAPPLGHRLLRRLHRPQEPQPEQLVADPRPLHPVRTLRPPRLPRRHGRHPPQPHPQPQRRQKEVQQRQVRPGQPRTPHHPRLRRRWD